MNAMRFAEPYGVPVVQVGSTDAGWLHEAAGRGDRATVIAHAVRVADTAGNVTATVRGTAADLPPVVVMTPRSGWWHCASERGGGLACWLETIRAAASARPSRGIEFVASSGHELGHLGLDAFIAERRGLVKTAAAWVHLGANIGAAGGRMRLQASDDQMEERASASMARAGTSIADRVPRGTVPAGEARNIHVGGGRYVSLLGSGPYFHSLADRWPDVIDVAAIARYAAAVADLGGDAGGMMMKSAAFVLLAAASLSAQVPIGKEASDLRAHLAMAALIGYLETWNSRDPKRWATSLHFPHVRPGPGAFEVSETPEQYAAGVNFNQTLATGWHHSEWTSRRVLHVGLEQAHVAGSWMRYTEDDRPLVGNDITYIVTSQGGRWGVLSRFAAGPSGLDAAATAASGAAARKALDAVLRGVEPARSFRARRRGSLSPRPDCRRHGRDLEDGG